MITDILYRCPECGEFEWLEDGRCRHCRVPVRVLSRKNVAVDGQSGDIAYWYAKVRGHALPQATDGMILHSGRVRLSREIQKGRFKGLSGVYAIRYGREFMTEGSIALYSDRLVFPGASFRESIPFECISAVTIESNTVIVDRTDARTVYIDFQEESGKKWEDCIQKAIARFFSPAEIVEFCPKIRFAQPSSKKPERAVGHHDIRVRAQKWYRSDFPPASSLLKRIAACLADGLLDIEFTGMENIPSRGAAILAANHVSFLDGIILAACLPRVVRFMTKNSQFNTPVMRVILKLGGTFPVKRYRTDVVAVRNALRVLQHGHVLGVFPEGERSWDGRMQPFKKGTLRLMMAAGKPVVPVGISGIYELMPRWTTTLRRVPVRITVGEPLRFTVNPIGCQTEEDIAAADERLRRTIETLIIPLAQV
ncbi:MAG: 1-acyl-sn-glycerol-3-phosphate acyltransferase [Deltaproteobacteria bacterium]|nr:1-acyl-sn-glycerol-3-phosphate acyltransferase [Deltaproteobacteria bacterium]